MRKGKGRWRRGSALVMSLIAVVIVMLLMLGFTKLASTVVLSQSSAVQRKRAFYVAEAGLSEAFTGLQMGKSGAVGSEESPAVFGDGLLWVEAEEEDGVVELHSTGMVAGGHVKLSMVAERGEANLASLGLFSGQTMELAPGTIVDSFDSTVAPYDPNAPGTNASVISNETIRVQASPQLATIVRGSVTPGPQYVASINANAVVTGSIAPGLKDIVLPPVSTPRIVVGSAINHRSASPLILLPGSSGFASINLADDTQAILQGPMELLVGRLVLGNGSELAFDTTGGPVMLYVTEHLVLPPGSLVSTSSTDARQVTIQISARNGDPIPLASTASFYGVIYAPANELVLSSEFEVFGSVVAETLSFSGAGRIHFDERLLALTEESALPNLVSWNIVDMGSDMTGLRKDPFKALGVRKSSLSPPAQSHQDQWLTLRYLDANNTSISYDGWESDFDWNDVGRLIAGWRDGQDIIYAGKPISLQPSGMTRTGASSP